MTYTDTVRTAVDALRTIRGEWGALLVAVEQPPADEWPPREYRGGLFAGVDGGDPLLVVDRAPLTLRPYSAPANLDALDAGVFVERALFDLADTIAAAAQRPITRAQVAPLRWEQDDADAADPRRWAYPSPTSPGSRAHGAEFAALWVEGRVLDDDLDDELLLDGRRVPALFLALPEHLLHEAHRVARRCAERIRRALLMEERPAPGTAACPWCGGVLTLHTRRGEPERITCATGAACPAPASVDDAGRRTWAGDSLLALVTDLAGAAAA
ncbi:hypothetical protein [Embleya sp. MST-111070]|uniref:hypothetical protein n=1 Tax=Embleya sp. MST-111070 TaxID=3398231 RepID=UPI003F7403B2